MLRPRRRSQPDPAGSEGARRRTQGPITRRLARLPILVYRLGLGRLLGNRFVMVEHLGRRSGLVRRTVLEVIGRGVDTLDVPVAWGRGSDWFRNVTAHPRVRVSSGRLRGVPATAEVLDPAAAAEVFRRYASEHPRAARILAKTFRLPFHDPRAVAEQVPVVRFHLER